MPGNTEARALARASGLGSSAAEHLIYPEITQAQRGPQHLPTSTTPARPPVRRIPMGVRGTAKPLLPDRNGFKPDKRRHRRAWLEQIKAYVTQPVIEPKRRAEIWLCARSICRAFAFFGWRDVEMAWLLKDTGLAPRALTRALFALRRGDQLAWSRGPRGYRFRPKVSTATI